ncbi:hypothetical protein [Aliarcobacter cryaerophilus]|uniref:hypothetical protein n=1 Tax=Aliarcobacter cryaerophilus TaxID=28198 RepID=UPI003BAEE38B
MKEVLIWEKLGRIITSSHLEGIGISHPIPSFVEKINKENYIKIYFNTRDKNNRSELRSLLLDINSLEVSEISNTLFKYGDIGTFDEHGVEVCSTIDLEDEKLLFYQGWSRSSSMPSICSIGLARMKNSKVDRVFYGPILTKSSKEPYDCAAPFVLKVKNTYFMYYSSVDSIQMINGKLTQKYNIKIATSDDAINWAKLDKIAINYEKEEEYAFGRPFVLIDGNIFKMWYCYKGDNYRIGYAESFDGIHWIRKDEINIFNKNSEEWDLDMQEYPLIFDYNENRYLLYCGNDYGKTGIGLSRLKK